jgi:hypothetical protein
MTRDDVGKVVAKMGAWWERVHITPALAKDVWCPRLAAIPLDVAFEALTQYARKQRGNYPPSLEDLLTHCEEVQDERHRAVVQARRAADDQLAMQAWQKAQTTLEAERRLRPVVDPITHVLENAVHDPWAYGHSLMHEKGVNRPGREADAAAFCEAMAVDHPDDRDMWRAEAWWWQQGAHGAIPWSTAMMRGERVGAGRMREPGEELGC